ncbi:EVE domain-containing protein [Streptomyces sp. DSM 15324]|uniref:EVE domain-containing protein n=1 Tax=Streptomyces sp. DSM 15324 TaxID=1739111 RepID=UPI000AFC6B2F|nr:EVE domain-containing protein [Streptomyces sp. DSM 15324]
MHSLQTVIPLGCGEAPAREEAVAPERAWLGVVSADHARRASRYGWIQLNHGDRRNLVRLRRGDGFVFYSPTEHRGGREKLRAFTALGTVADDEPRLADEVVDMGERGTLRPWRRTVDFLPVHAVALHAVTHELLLTRDRNWGYQLRFGLVPLAVADFEVLRGAMER